MKPIILRTYFKPSYAYCHKYKFKIIETCRFNPCEFTHEIKCRDFILYTQYNMDELKFFKLDILDMSLY